MDDKALIRGLLHVVNAVAMTDEYKSWDHELSRKEVSKALEALHEYIDKAKIDWGSLSWSELKTFGFKAWDEPNEEGDVVMLMPLYLLKVMPEGTVLTGIGGGRVTVGKDNIDNDVRFGCIAYGFKVKEEPDAV